MEGTPALLKLLVNKGWIDAAELDKEETKFPFVNLGPTSDIPNEDIELDESVPDKVMDEEESIIHPEDLSTDQEKETPKAKAVKPKQNKNKK